MDAGSALALLSSAITTLGGALDLFKSANDLRSAHDEKIAAAKEQLLQVKEALYTSKDAIFTLKDEATEMVNRIKELEVQLRRREEHSLQELGPGAFAYVAKEPHDAIKKGPWLCQPCFDDGKPAVLQLAQPGSFSNTFKCPRCEATIRVRTGDIPRVSFAHRQSYADDDGF